MKWILGLVGGALALLYVIGTSGTTPLTASEASAWASSNISTYTRAGTSISEPTQLFDLDGNPIETTITNDYIATYSPTNRKSVWIDKQSDVEMGWCWEFRVSFKHTDGASAGSDMLDSDCYDLSKRKVLGSVSSQGPYIGPNYNDLAWE